jgi:hypothetical protein
MASIVYLAQSNLQFPQKPNELLRRKQLACRSLFSSFEFGLAAFAHAARFASEEQVIG